MASVTSCYDDSEIKSKLDDYGRRILALETLCKEMNTTISSLQSIVAALQNKDYVTGVNPVMQGTAIIGYTISFTKSDPITIYHGTDGKDGNTPVVGVALSENGIYCWTLDGSWLLDANGNKIPALGVDGKDGLTPQLKIEDDYWFISYDDGTSWTQLGKATGKDGDTIFLEVDFTSDTDYVIFTLADSTQIKIPSWAAFEELQRKVNELNTNLSSLQTIVNALQGNDYVTGVTPYMQDGKQIGYAISFSKSGSIVIFNGKDGVDGSTPQIGVKQDTDGNWYWTIDCDWMVDADGNKVRANGVDGKAGISPQLKIEDDYWHISYDNGDSWSKLGKSSGKDGTDIFKACSQDSNNVYLTLSDGTSITLPKTQNKSIQSIVFLPEYENGYAYVKINGGSKKLKATLQIRPSEYASKLVKEFNSGKKDFLYADVLPVRQVKSAQMPITLPLSSLSLLADGVVDASFDASSIDIVPWNFWNDDTQLYMCCFYAQYENVFVSSSYVFMIGDAGTNLSESGTANCYIVNEAGDYMFKTVKGNSGESVGAVSSVAVLWESFGTDKAPNVGDIIKNVSYADGYVHFSTPASFKNGNAVIAAKDASGNILWSWHIWACKGYDAYASGQRYNNNAGIMMDRNLGATSATPGDVHALGLLYQWGRKDPFLGGSSISYSEPYYQSKATSTNTWQSAVTSDSSNGTISYAVAHPTTFITCNSDNNDWYYTGDDSTDNSRWGIYKTIYDPCPAGWRVPDGGESGVWANAFGRPNYWETASNWDSTNMGMDFGSTDLTLGSGTIWYPAAGYLYSKEGSLSHVGSKGDYWPCSPYDSNANTYDLYFNNTGRVYPSGTFARANGTSVRCCREW